MDSVVRLFAELQRRKVIRVAVTYGVVAWLVVQVAETVFEPLLLPGWALTLVVVLAILGFPVAVALAPAFPPSRPQPPWPRRPRRPCRRPASRRNPRLRCCLSWT
jgi:hypothetical protein